MTTYAWVNPANTADIAVEDLDGKPLQYTPNGGQRNQVRLPDGAGGERSFAMGPSPVPAFDLYTRTHANNSAPGPSNYYTTTPSYAFSGGVRQATGLVTESNNWTQVDIDTLLQIKEQELLTHTEAVFFSSFKMTGGGGVEFWVNASLRSRTYRTDVDAFYQWVPPAEPAPLNLITATGREAVVSNTGRAWRDIPVWLVRVSNGNHIRTKVDQEDWEALKEAQGRFSIDTAYASDDVQSLLETQHGAGNWQALADIDVTADPNATNPWPEHSVSAFNGAAF